MSGSPLTLLSAIIAVVCRWARRSDASRFGSSPQPCSPSRQPRHQASRAPTVTGVVTIVQESRDPTSASAPFDGIGSLDAELVPGQSWSMTTYSEGEFQPLV